MRKNKKEAVILIHGLWMKGPELLYVRYKLWREGYRVYQFHYPSIFKTAEENAAKLYQLVSNIDAAIIHFVVHSFGGIVVAHLFQRYEIKTPGKVVLIASPVNGSAAAVYLNQRKYLKYLLGRSVVKGLLGDAPGWSYKRKICVVAGTKGLGASYFLANKAMQKPNDGTVNLYETKLEKADESHEIPRSHFLLLFSNEVVKIIVNFLRKN
jgi:alpha-beta hydrolase superfamily lysophospholipase